MSHDNDPDTSANPPENRPDDKTPVRKIPFPTPSKEYLRRERIQRAIQSGGRPDPNDLAEEQADEIRYQREVAEAFDRKFKELDLSKPPSVPDTSEKVKPSASGNPKPKESDQREEQSQKNPELIAGIVLACLGMVLAIALVLAPPTSGRIIGFWLLVMFILLAFSALLIVNYFGRSLARIFVAILLSALLVGIFGWYVFTPASSQAVTSSVTPTVTATPTPQPSISPSDIATSVTLKALCANGTDPRCASPTPTLTPTATPTPPINPATQPAAITTPSPTLPSDTKIGLLQCSVSERLENGFRTIKHAVCVAKHQQTGLEFIGTVGERGWADMNVPYGFYIVTIKAEGYLTRVEAVKVGEEVANVVIELQRAQ